MDHPQRDGQEILPTLGVTGIAYRATKLQFEAALRAVLTRPDSVTVHWPAPSSTRLPHQYQHQGDATLLFDNWHDWDTAERELGY
jgi:hypothetical protein